MRIALVTICKPLAKQQIFQGQSGGDQGRGNISHEPFWFTKGRKDWVAADREKIPGKTLFLINYEYIPEGIIPISGHGWLYFRRFSQMTSFHTRVLDFGHPGPSEPPGSPWEPSLSSPWLVA